VIFSLTDITIPTFLFTLTQDIYWAVNTHKKNVVLT
jgi:hypothetical protein